MMEATRQQSTSRGRAAGDCVGQRVAREHRNNIAAAAPSDASYALTSTVQDDMSAFIETMSAQDDSISAVRCKHEAQRLHRTLETSI